MRKKTEHPLQWSSKFPRWAITGNIGSGKSTVANLMGAVHGWKIIDADHETRALYRQNGPLRLRLAEIFGKEILTGATKKRPEGNDIDRRKLGELVFSDDAALQQLNAVVHAPLIERIIASLKEEANQQKVVLDAALVIEWGMIPLFDRVILVTADDLTRVERVMTRSGESVPDKAWNRLRTQMPQEEKLKTPGLIELRNDGTLKELAENLKAIVDG